MTTDPTAGQYGPYGSDSTSYPPPFAARAGGLIPRFFARLIDGIIVVIVSCALIFVTDSLSNFWVTGLFTGLLTFVYFLVFETSRDRRRVRSCSAWRPRPRWSTQADRPAVGDPQLVDAAADRPVLGGLLASSRSSSSR